MVLEPPGYAKGLPIGVPNDKVGVPEEVNGGIPPPDETGNSSHEA